MYQFSKHQNIGDFKKQLGNTYPYFQVNSLLRSYFEDCPVWQKQILKSWKRPSVLLKKVKNDST